MGQNTKALVVQPTAAVHAYSRAAVSAQAGTNGLTAGGRKAGAPTVAIVKNAVSFGR